MSIPESFEAWTQKLSLPLKPIPQALLNFLQKLLDLDLRSRPKAEDWTHGLQKIMIHRWRKLSSRKTLRTNIQVQSVLPRSSVRFQWMRMPDIREQWQAIGFVVYTSGVTDICIINRLRNVLKIIPSGTLFCLSITYKLLRHLTCCAVQMDTS